MRIFLAGGTGVIGQRLIPQLVERGHQVTATTRNPDKVAMLEKLGATGVVMDGLDAAGVGEAVAAARPDVVVHQMTAIATDPDYRNMDKWFAPTNRLRIEGTDNLIAAAQAAGVPDVIAQGYASSNGIQQGGWVKTESDPLDPMAGTKAQEQSRAIEHLERAVVSAGGTVLRYGSLYGAGATDDQVEMIRKRMFPLVGGGAGYMSWIHLEDAAAATVLAIEQHAKGVFNIVDDEPAPARDWLSHLADSADAKPPMRVPAWLAKLIAGDVAVMMMTEGRAFTNAKAKAELGWQPRYPSWRQGFVDGLAA